MELKVKNISSRMSDYKYIKRVYNESFPRRERLPITVLLIMAQRKNVKFLAFYDESIFCGFTYLIGYGDTTFLFYLAVDGGLRSRGYGSQILKWLSMNTTKTIALQIETTEKNDYILNYNQRMQRLNFYNKNGYKDAGITMRQNAELYDVLYNGESFSEEEMRKLLRIFSFGFSQLILKIEKK